MVVALRVAACWALVCSRISRNVTMHRIAITVRELPRITMISGRPVLPETCGRWLAVIGRVSVGGTV
ncbi:hypothetical protein D3C75_1118420 [compost metagenome]